MVGAAVAPAVAPHVAPKKTTTHQFISLVNSTKHNSLLKRCPQVEGKGGQEAEREDTGLVWGGLELTTSCIACHDDGGAPGLADAVGEGAGLDER
jgi:mono/diheme cytochrome c family protein